MWWLASEWSSVSVPCGRTNCEPVALIMNCFTVTICFILPTFKLLTLQQKSSLTLHVLIFTTLQDFTWCLVITPVSLLARSWSSIGSRYTTGSDILLFCRHTKQRYESISGVSYMGLSVSVFLSVHDTWISALSIAPNISTFLSVLDGFCRSNLRL